MVSEAQNKIIQTVKQVAKHVGHLVALAGSDLYFSEENKDDTTSIQVKTAGCWKQQLLRLVLEKCLYMMTTS